MQLTEFGTRIKAQLVGEHLAHSGEACQRLGLAPGVGQSSFDRTAPEPHGGLQLGYRVAYTALPSSLPGPAQVAVEGADIELVPGERRPAARPVGQDHRPTVRVRWRSSEATLRTWSRRGRRINVPHRVEQAIHRDLLRHAAHRRRRGLGDGMPPMEVFADPSRSARPRPRSCSPPCSSCAGSPTCRSGPTPGQDLPGLAGRLVRRRRLRRHGLPLHNRAQRRRARHIEHPRQGFARPPAAGYVGPRHGRSGRDKPAQPVDVDRPHLRGRSAQGL